MYEKVVTKCQALPTTPEHLRTTVDYLLITIVNQSLCGISNFISRSVGKKAAVIQ